MSEHIDRYTLDAYVEQILPAVERRAVESHVTTCPTCQARVAAAKQIPAFLFEMPREKPTPELAARINAAVAARGTRRASSSSKWMPMLVLVMFAAGLGLLALATPQWSGWVSAAATAQLPSEQTISTWLSSLVADPTIALDAMMTFLEQTVMGAADDVGLLITSATVLLAAASIAALVQLLGGERPMLTVAETQP